MNILYGVQATGNGHISRSREVIAALRDRGHHVFTVFSGRDPEKLWDVESFRPFTAYTGLTFAVRNGKVKHLETVKNLRPVQFYKDIASFDASSFDVALTDFEPITARVAKRFAIPCIGIGHQYAFRFPVPLAGRDPVAQLVMKYFAPVDTALGLHYHHFNCPVLPPIIPRLTADGIETIPGKILVYLPFEDRNDVLHLISGYSDCSFYFYSAVASSRDDENVHMRPFSRTGFIDDLISCEGVISNAGFELTSEAIHLGKKLLVRPLAGQLEQTSNALALEKLKRASVMHSLDKDMLTQWLKSPPPAPLRYTDVAGIVADWVTAGRRDSVDGLCDAAWEHVDTG